MPELPAASARFIGEYGLKEYDAGVLTATRPVSEYYETWPGSRATEDRGQLGDGDLMGMLKPREGDCGIACRSREPGRTGEADCQGRAFRQARQGSLPENVLHRRAGRRHRGTRRAAADQRHGALEKIIADVIAANPKQVEQYKGGKTTVINFLVARRCGPRGTGQRGAGDRFVQARTG